MSKTADRVGSWARPSLVVAAALLAGCAEEAGQAEQAGDSASFELGLSSSPSPSSPTLAVPEGNKLAFALGAVGVQIYVCQADANGVFGWTFTAPEATLYGCSGEAGTHYAGPTWEALDASKVVAARVAGYSPDPSAIPELLLQATGHEGAGQMAKVTYIQRLETTGGIAPATGCDAGHLGEFSRVDYTATYYFYRARSARK